MCDLPYPDADGPRAVDACPLSNRELQVLEHLAAGESYNQIAAGLDLLTSTVRNHLASIYRKLDVIDRAQAVLVATRRGWLRATLSAAIAAGEQAGEARGGGATRLVDA